MFNGVFWSYLNPLFFVRYARPRNLTPKLEVGGVADLSAEHLAGLGVRALIFDVDNTLCSFHGRGIDETLDEAMKKLCARFKCCILSNTPSMKRIEELKEFFPLPVADSIIKKPSPEAFGAALKFLGTKPSETAMVGDRLLTDIAGANNLGILSIKVKPLRPETEPAGLKVVRFLESTLLALYYLIA